MVELVVVIAILGVLMAMIFSTLYTSRAREDEVRSAAHDFYIASQYMFTKYSKYEYYLWQQQRNDQKPSNADNVKQNCVMMYESKLSGNYPIYPYVFVHVCVEKGKVSYVDAVANASADEAMKTVLSRENAQSSMTSFEKTFANDIGPMFQMQDGHYYALVKYDANLSDVSAQLDKMKSVRVLMAGYGDVELPVCSVTTPFSAYRDQSLFITDTGRIGTQDEYFGVWSSQKTKTGVYLGTSGSHFAYDMPSSD